MKTKLLSHIRWFASLNSVALLLALGLGGASTARAASDSWNVDADGNWFDAANWLSGTQSPGNLVADNSDVATFSNTLTVNRAVIVDTGRFIGGIDFGNTSAFRYFLNGAGTGTLLLNNGGVIQTLPGNGAHTDLVGAPVTINGSGTATATFTAGATLATSILDIRAVTGSATPATPTTLNLDGANTGGNVMGGVIADGAGGPLSIVKSGTGFWQFQGNNTFTGPIAINAGTLAVGGTPGRLGGGNYAGNITNNSIFRYSFTSVGDQILSGNISGTGRLEMTSGAMVALAGTNTYTGGTSNTALGILVFRNTAAKPATGTVVATNAAANSSGIGLGVGASGTNFTSADVDSLWANTLAGVNISIKSGVGIDTTAGDFTYTLPSSPSRAFHKLGVNTLNLAGVNISTNTIFVNGGILNITGSVSNSPSQTKVGDFFGAKSMLVVPTGGQYASDEIIAGQLTAGSAPTFGSLVINGGDVKTTTTAGEGIRIGWGTYGGFFMSSGSVKTHWYDAGVGNVLPTTVSVGQITGGNFTNDHYIILRGKYNEFTLVNGNMIRRNASDAISMGEAGVSNTVFTIAGGFMDTVGTLSFVKFNRTANTTAKSSFNLNGGTLLTSQIGSGTFITALGSSTVNFNGGTLQAGANAGTGPTTAFLAFGITAAYVNGAFGSYAGGAVVDNNGFTNMFATPLLAPTGNGVSGLTLANAGSGYIGAPYVDITGDGTGATAYAQVNLDPVSGTFGQVTNVVLSNPGVNYTTIPTITLRGGGGSGAAVTVNGITANISGGLTKNGAGALILSTVNTYTGATLVNNGTLLVNSPGSLDAGSAVTVNAVGTLGGSGTIGGPVTFTAGSHAVFSDAAPLTMSSSLNIATSGTIPDVHLNLSGVLLAGNYTLATYNTAGSSGAFNSTPILDSGSFDVGLTGTIVTSGGNVVLQVAPSAPSTPPNFPPGGITVAGGTVSLTATGAVGTAYRLWASTNVAATPITNTWTLLTNGTITVSPFTITDPDATNYPHRFYLFSTP